MYNDVRKMKKTITQSVYIYVHRIHICRLEAYVDWVFIFTGSSNLM